jgi:hypothetical protein
MGVTMRRDEVAEIELRRSGSFIGVGGLAVMAFPYFLSGLLAPLWAVLVLVGIWLVYVALACEWFRTRPLWVLLLPASLAVIWLAAMYGGEAFLGWTA